MCKITFAHYTSLDQTHKRSSLKLYSSGENSPYLYTVYATQVRAYVYALIIALKGTRYRLHIITITKYCYCVQVSHGAIYIYIERERERERSWEGESFILTHDHKQTKVEACKFPSMALAVEWQSP